MAQGLNFAILTQSQATQELDARLTSNVDLTQENLVSIQKLLDFLGHKEVGTADGIMGPNTANAIATYLNNDSMTNESINPEIAEQVTSLARSESVAQFQSLYGASEISLKGSFAEKSQNLDHISKTLETALDSSNITDLQSFLNAAGYNVGRTDGIIGKLTSEGTLNYLGNNPNALLSIDSKNLETILDKAEPRALDNFRTQLEYSPEFYDLLESKIDTVNGDLSIASPEQIKEIQTMMTAYGIYDRGIDGIAGSGTRAGLDKFAEMERPAETVALKIEVTSPLETAPVIATNVASLGNSPEASSGFLSGGFGLVSAANARPLQTPIIATHKSNVAPNVASTAPEALTDPVINTSETTILSNIDDPLVLQEADSLEAPASADDYGEAVYAAIDTIDGFLKPEDAELVGIHSSALAFGPYAPDDAYAQTTQIHQRLLTGTIDGQQFAVQKVAEMAVATIKNIDSGEITIPEGVDTTPEGQRALAESIHDTASRFGKSLGIEVPGLPNTDTPNSTPLSQEFIGAALGAPANSTDTPSVKIAGGSSIDWEKASIAAAPRFA